MENLTKQEEKIYIEAKKFARPSVRPFIGAGLMAVGLIGVLAGSIRDSSPIKSWLAVIGIGFFLQLVGYHQFRNRALSLIKKLSENVSGS